MYIGTCDLIIIKNLTPINLIYYRRLSIIDTYKCNRWSLIFIFFIITIKVLLACLSSKLILIGHVNYK